MQTFTSTEHVSVAVDTDARTVTSRFRITDKKAGIETTPVTVQFNMGALSEAQIMAGCAKHLQLLVREKTIKPGVIDGTTEFEFDVPAELFTKRNVEPVSVATLKKKAAGMTAEQRRALAAELLAMDEQDA